MSIRHDSILDTVGATPVVRLARLAPAHVNLFAKIEARNPMGSVKDRLALAVIEDAERSGALSPGQTVIEATSGNTGIALAMVCARKGYPLVVVMAENFSVERRRLMRFLGARVVLTPAALKGTGMIRKAEELAGKHGWFLCRQFDNPANAAMHERTTGPEILAAFADTRLDYFVAGCGTGGTIAGVARALRRASPATQVIACEPDNAPVLASGIAQPREANGTPAGSHPSFRPHPMQGWSPDFVSSITESALHEGLVDRVVPVSGHEAMRLARELARQEGICTGITGGAALAGALSVAATAPTGSSILCLLPDTGERYQSTALFADIPVDMTEEELELSRSTPAGRFDAPAPALPVAAAVPAPVDREAQAFIEGALADRSAPAVMFALEWCEFCWAVRRLFARLRIPLKSVDLDSTTYQAGDLGGRIRAALTARTGISTIPQIFAGGEFVGGCTDVIDALRRGELQSRLATLGIPIAGTLDADPSAFLPAWLQPR